MWAALGRANAPPPPVWGERTADAARAVARTETRRGSRYRLVSFAAAAAVVGGLVGVASWRGFGSAPVPPEDIPLVEQLEFAESLDLVSHPDFDVLLAWDGVAP